MSKRLGRTIGSFDAFLFNVAKRARYRKRIKKPMNVAALLANCTVGDPVPRFKVQKSEEWGVQLNSLGPKRVVRTNIAAKLNALNHDWSMLWVHVNFASERAA